MRTIVKFCLLVVVVSIVIISILYLSSRYQSNWQQREYIGMLQAVKYKQNYHGQVYSTTLVFADREFELDDYYIGYEVGKTYKVTYHFDAYYQTPPIYIDSVELQETTPE